MGGEHDVCHYVSNCSSFKAPVLLPLRSAVFYQNLVGVPHVTHSIAVLHLLLPLVSLDLICYISQTGKTFKCQLGKRAFK